MAAELPPQSRHASQDLVDVLSSNSTTVDSDETLEKIETTKSRRSTRTVKERQFEPINPGDREELNRIASTFTRTNTNHSRRSQSNAGDDLERKDTLAGISAGDAVLDPSSPEFDSYKWARMYVDNYPIHN